MESFWRVVGVFGGSYGKVAGLVAVVAAAVGTTVQAKGRAVSLDVTEALAVVALLSWKRVSITGRRIAGR